MNNVLGTLISTGGWIGAAELLAAYILVSKGRLAGDSLRYQALNISASVLLLVNCAYTGAWPSAIANSFYVLVGIVILLTVKRAYIAQLARRRRFSATAHLARRRRLSTAARIRGERELAA